MYFSNMVPQCKVNEQSWVWPIDVPEEPHWQLSRKCSKQICRHMYQQAKLHMPHSHILCSIFIYINNSEKSVMLFCLFFYLLITISDK